MTYIYRDRELFLGNKKYLLEWCDGVPYIQNLETKEKTFIQMIDISNFVWVVNKIKYHLNIDRSTRRPAKEKKWNGFKNIEVEECDCTLKTEKI